MKKNYLLSAFINTPWALLPNKLMILEDIVIRHVNGENLEPDEVQTQLHGGRRPVSYVVNQAGGERGVSSVAVLPLFGTIFPRANLMTSASGATSAEKFTKEFRGLVSDPEIGAIVLDVDSPGGQVGGIDELSAEIYNARGTKPIVAVANHTMASAAYWIGTAADEVVITPSGEVGSIGVFAVHQDISQALEKDGIKTSLISAGKYKVEGNPYEPLGEEARAAIQAGVDDFYGAFVEAVARNRGVDMDTVRNGFGEGRMVGSRRAVDLGMADRIATLDETIDSLLLTENKTGVELQVILPGELHARSDAEQTSQEAGPDNESSNLDDELEAQAQRLRDEINQYLLEKE